MDRAIIKMGDEMEAAAARGEYRTAADVAEARTAHAAALVEWETARASPVVPANRARRIAAASALDFAGHRLALTIGSHRAGRV